MNEKGTGLYSYKGFTIWSPGGRVWIAEPKWKNIDAVEKYKSTRMKEFETIAKAKKWINNEGINLKEDNYL